MKINREQAKKMIEDAGFIFRAETLGTRHMFRAACIGFMVQGSVNIFDQAPADADEMVDSEYLQQMIDLAKADGFVQRHHFGKE